MKSALYRPVYPLSGFISHFFFYEGFQPSHSHDLFLPDGQTELIIELSGLPQHIFEPTSLKPVQQCTRAWISGIRTRPIIISSGLNSRMLIVSFKQGRTWPFYSFPMSEITDRVVAAVDTLPGFRTFYDSLLNETDPHQLFQLLETYLLQLSKGKLESATPTSCIHYSINKLTSHAGKQSLSDLSKTIGYSQKHFISLFRKQVGVSPREFAGINRFQQVIRHIEDTPSTDWQQVVHLYGFYDQSHLIHEFKRYSGLTPDTYLAGRGPFLNYLPLA